MNSKSFPSASQCLLNSSNNKPLISSFTPQLSFTYNNTPVKIPRISIRKHNITAKATVATAAAIPETLYDLLGISNNGTLSEIKHAYKKMALKYHPDVSPPDRTEEYTVRFIRVQDAYETLSDPETRSVYDSCMAKGIQYAFSGKRKTRFHPRSSEKNRWKEMWSGQISELTRRSKMNPGKEMSWAARIRKQRSESHANGWGQD
ncbi:chaperone protein dnaJ 20, chloroplastic-like [Rutidosis leptorrhynchoides]|uniref:chaperone protein dnaJ 20, chloroplastic-like n=1 Tax=Rutidosis leptorrhynchoides TaxID=125765 RepID=UPI003A9A0770